MSGEQNPEAISERGKRAKRRHERQEKLRRATAEANQKAPAKAKRHGRGSTAFELSEDQLRSTGSGSLQRDPVRTHRPIPVAIRSASARSAHRRDHGRSPAARRLHFDGASTAAWDHSHSGNTTEHGRRPAQPTTRPRHRDNTAPTWRKPQTEDSMQAKMDRLEAENERLRQLTSRGLRTEPQTLRASSSSRVTGNRAIADHMRVTPEDHRKQPKNPKRKSKEVAGSSPKGKGRHKPIPTRDREPIKQRMPVPLSTPNTQGPQLQQNNQEQAHCEPHGGDSGRPPQAT